MKKVVDPEKVKQAIRYILLARKLDNLGFRTMVESESFMAEVIEPLKQSCGWDKEDEKEVEKLASEFKKEVAGYKTLSEKNLSLRKILKIGIFGLAAGAGAAALSGYLKNKNKEEEKK